MLVENLLKLESLEYSKAKQKHDKNKKNRKLKKKR